MQQCLVSLSLSLSSSSVFPLFFHRDIHGSELLSDRYGSLVPKMVYETQTETQQRAKAS